LSLQPFEEFPCCPIVLRLEPRHHARPHRFEGVTTGAPMPGRFGALAMGWSRLAVSPRGSEASEEAIEISIAVREDMQTFAREEPGQVMLDRSDLVEQSKRVERDQHRTQSFFHRITDDRRCQ
jgi:hypothetical protein